jgi:hypothetical protein
MSRLLSLDDFCLKIFMSDRMLIAFLICTEPGRLEGQSILLAESIRKFAGSMKDTPIYSFHPRAGNPIALQTQKKFDQLGVIHEQIPLNVEFHDYYLANKPFVCAHAEQVIDADILVFLDSDKCIFQAPEAFFLPDGYNVGLRPEYGRGIGSCGKGDRNEVYWQTLYDLFEVQQEIYVTTPIGNKRIRGYWNSGMVVVRRSAGIFSAWKENFIKVMHLGIQPVQGNYMVEQSLLSITVCALNQSIYTLPSSYSYPLPLHNRLSKDCKIDLFDNIVSIHYFNMFFFDNWKSRLNQLKKIDLNSERYDWLYEQLSTQKFPSKTWAYTFHMLRIRLNNKIKPIISKAFG